MNEGKKDKGGVNSSEAKTPRPDVVPTGSVKDYFKGETLTFSYEEIEKIIKISIEEGINIVEDPLICSPALKPMLKNKLLHEFWTEKLSPVTVNGGPSKYSLK